MADLRGFGNTPEGETVQLVTLAAGALSVRLLTWGARLHDVRLAGTPWPLVLGSPTLDGYLGSMANFGPVVGPVANRIAGAEAVIAGRRHRLVANEAGRTTLHGGPRGCHRRNWALAEATATRAVFTLDLPDGDEGFPGNRRLVADYSLSAPATLDLRLSATTDRATLVNLAPHPYWNLDGAPDISGHRLTVAAERYTETDAALIPTGALPRVAGSRFDFRAGQGLDTARDLDLNLCLADAPRPLTEVARLEGAKGVTLALATTEPGLQVHDAPRMDTAPMIGLSGQPYGPRAGIALEPQLWPDACHHPGFPPIDLGPGETRVQHSRMTFDRIG